MLVAMLWYDLKKKKEIKYRPCVFVLGFKGTVQPSMTHKLYLNFDIAISNLCKIKEDVELLCALVLL